MQGKKHKPKNTQYFSEVCVVFSHARKAFPKNVEVKHTIYFDWPYVLLVCSVPFTMATSIILKCPYHIFRDDISDKLY